MKKLILAILPAAMLFTGCENACDTGLVLKGKLQSLETTVMGTITSPGAMDTSCAGFRATSIRELHEGSKFAARVADDYFYSEERFCRAGHYVQQCSYGSYYPGHPGHHPGYPGYPGYPGQYPPYYDCQNVFVCDDLQIIPHKKDGFEDAMELSSLLASSEGNLSGGCAAHDRGADVDALAHLAQAKGELHNAVDSAEVVLTKAGCYERKGD